MRAGRYDYELKIKRRKRRRRILLALILLMVIGVAAELFMLSKLTTVDRVFLRSAERGIADGWALENNDLQFENGGMIYDTAFIDAEYDAVSEYRNREFEDKELGKIAKDYITALAACRKAKQKHDPNTDYEKFWKAFSKPYGARLAALYRLSAGDYKIDLGNEEKYPGRSVVLARGWLMDKVSDLTLTRSKTEGGFCYAAEFTNDSGAEIEMIDIDVDLINKKGKRIEVASAYMRDIPVGGRIKLKCYQTVSGAVKYRIANVTCTFRSDRGRSEDGDTDDDDADTAEQDDTGGAGQSGGDAKPDSAQSGGDAKPDSAQSGSDASGGDAQGDQNQNGGDTSDGDRSSTDQNSNGAGQGNGLPEAEQGQILT